MKIVESSYTKVELDRPLAEMAETGDPVTITDGGRPVAMLTSVTHVIVGLASLPGPGSAK